MISRAMQSLFLSTEHSEIRSFAISMEDYKVGIEHRDLEVGSMLSAWGAPAISSPVHLSGPMVLELNGSRVI